ncbi:MAG: Dephospho-CoA kinase [Nitrospira sp.]|nr:dephospho-CoA kinase [Nitrospira sp.]ULA60362.1 MAG: Dephospho-CoA kinase [Nitrospira sp.]
MILVGLTGGVATGKSTVAKMFERCGAFVIDADALAHQVMEPGKPAWRAIVDTFGKAVLHPDRTLNRQTLGAIVFRHPAKLRRLEQIIHPRVAREQARLTRQAGRKDPNAVVIYDVPLLYEAGIDKRVDTIIVVTADRDTQIARLKQRNGFTRAEAIRRIRSQMPIKQKAAAADYLLDGTAPRSRLFAQVRRLYRELYARDASRGKNGG